MRLINADALPKFPTMLRKMWSGGEVEQWVQENIVSAPTVEQDSGEAVCVIKHKEDGAPYVEWIVGKTLVDEALLYTSPPTVKQDSEPVYQIVHSPRHEWQEVSKEVYDSYGEEGKKRILHTSPFKREWVGLSAEQKISLYESNLFEVDLINAVEAKLKEGNGYA